MGGEAKDVFVNDRRDSEDRTSRYSPVSWSQDLVHILVNVSV